MIPIGGDIMGGKFLDERQGCRNRQGVFLAFWGTPDQCVYLVADSFEDFLRRQELCDDE